MRSNMARRRCSYLKFNGCKDYTDAMIALPCNGSRLPSHRRERLPTRLIRARPYGRRSSTTTPIASDRGIVGEGCEGGG